jgi:hypothetical protein
MSTIPLKVSMHTASARSISAGLPAEHLYGQSLQRDYKRLSETGSAVLRAWRQEAMARFERLGFPTRRLEAWRTFPLRPILNREFEIPPHPAEGFFKTDFPQWPVSA